MKKQIKACGKYIANLPLEKKILSLLFFSICSTFFLSLFGTSYVLRSSNELLYQTLAGSLNYSAETISMKLGNIEAMTSTMVSNKTLQKNLITVYDDTNPIRLANARNTLTTLIFDYYQNNTKNNLNYMNLYTDKFTVSSYEPQISALPDDVLEGILQKANKNSGYPCWVSDYCNEYGLFLVRDSRRVNQMSFETLGTIVAAVDMDKLIKSSTKSILQSEATPYLLYQNGAEIYHSKSLTQKLAQEIRQQFKAPYCILDINGEPYFCASGTISSMSWEYICMIPYHSIAHTIRFSHMLSVTLLLAASGLLLLLARTMTHTITKDFQRLVYKMKAFGKDESRLPDIGYDYSVRTDEIGILHNQFDQMAGKLQQLIQENYVNEILTKDAKLKALENQINPHFLYNTLESINWRAKAIHEEQISAMVEALGSMLRFTLNSKKQPVTLDDELSIVRDYITIQKLRFDDGRLSYEEEIPTEFLSLPLPQLTLQPLVENAIRYALETNDEDCRIHIVCRETDGTIAIEIINSGSQFEENLLEKLASKEILSKGFGIGLLNIQHRLKLTFGEEYGLFLFNLNEQNAVAQIRIPGDHHVKNLNCRR
ncbi:MAG: sensor histidine kinase [Lachnospiraceae bacterium]|jgi:two-component system sensor histidine kinase YesM|nr:sensor histidine kinase [Lachnospiraceae bacterium]